MKKLKRVTYIICFALMLFAVGIKISAAESCECVISESGGEYQLTSYSNGNSGEIFRAQELSLVFSYLSSQDFTGRVVLNSVTADKTLNISGMSLTVSGSITFIDGATLSVENSDISLVSLKISFSDGGGIRLKSGNISAVNSEIASDATAVRLDYSSDARLSLQSGCISSSGSSSAIVTKQGTVRLLGGSVESVLGVGIENYATLIISDGASISADGYDVVTEAPISLLGAKSPTVKIKYNKSFAMGEIYCVLYDVSAVSLEGISLYSADGKEYKPEFFTEYEGIEEKNFGAVYLPYNVEYFVNGELYKSELRLLGERAQGSDFPSKEGYEFLYWSCDGAEFDFERGIDKNLQLNAIYKLSSPEFRISSLEFTYDGQEHSLKLDELSHPLLNSGTLSYIWYKNGVRYSDSYGELKLRNVSDSGVYFCEITFSHSADTVTVRTPEISVKVDRARVSVPTVNSLDYNGNVQTPNVYSTALYSVECSGGIYVGVYPVVFRLYDEDNYEFFENGETRLEKEFEIKRADNFWIDEINASDVYENAVPTPVAKSRFGDVKFVYSAEVDGVFVDTPPTVPGVYYVKAVVDGCENYSALLSSAYAFSVISERVSGMSLSTPPRVTSYSAFERFVYDGLALSVTFNSGRRELVGAESVAFSYQSAESFRYGDTGIIATYLGYSIVIPLQITKAEFDLSGFVFSDLTVYYDSQKHTILPSGTLPSGIDGAALEYSIVGEGINVGEYTVVISFFTLSKNYTIPESIHARLKILPMEVTVNWQDDNASYNGDFYTPKAYYVDIHGRKIALDVSGGASLAGKYTAVATSSDSNYKLLNDTYAFEIKKADYDFSGIYWTEGSFVYDGEEKRVFLSGLPSGVKVLGYGNASATDAGSYLAVVSLSYDERNYNPPPSITYPWEILKRDYDLSGISLEDAQYIYDGKIKYPTLLGDIPTGIDGIKLGYVFDKGAINVSEGRVTVSVIFTTESKNYNLPNSLSACVQILPKEIVAVWSSEIFVYNGALQHPLAYAKECEIEVLGGAVDSGDYIAYAISSDTNFCIINSEMPFTIQRAENLWVEYLTVEDVYFGRAVSPIAKAYAGSVTYKFYRDIELLQEIEMPTAVGEYYVAAYSDGDKNYSAIASAPVKFNIIAIVPIRLSVQILKDKITAFSKLTADDFVLTAHNNDQTSEIIPFEKIAIVYGTDGNLYVGEGKICFKYSALTYTSTVSVVRADYDMSGVCWSNPSPVYNGQPFSLYLVGLPSGVSVVSYEGMGFKNAGTYKVDAVFSYDEDNYNPPILPVSEITVRRAEISLPTVENFVYNGLSQSPDVDGGGIFTVFCGDAADAGKYYMSLSIVDTDNYEFVGGIFSATVEYSILKAPVVIEIENVDKYLFSRMPTPQYTIICGNVTPEELRLSFVFDKNRVSAISENPNYELTVIPGEVTCHNTLSEDGAFFVLLFILILILLTLLIIVFVLRRRRIVEYFGVNRVKRAKGASDLQKSEPKVEVDNASDTNEVAVQEPEENEKAPDIERATLAMNPDHADSLITDSLAKNLVRKDEYTVYTNGSKREIINVDTLSDNFTAGERVDVNRLKEMSLVPYDTAYIKVLARGIIDKPLKVYANDFSLSAVKMIALTGGEAIRVTTVKLKGNSEK